MNTEDVVSRGHTKGELFRIQFGFSKSMKRNMQKNGIHPTKEGLAEYATLRKPKRAERAKIKRAKRDKAKAGRKSKDIKKKS